MVKHGWIRTSTWAATNRPLIYLKLRASLKLVDRIRFARTTYSLQRSCTTVVLPAQREMMRNLGLEPRVVCTCDGVFPASLPALLELVALTGHLPSELEDGYVAHLLLTGSSAFVTSERTAIHHASPVSSLLVDPVGLEPTTR